MIVYISLKHQVVVDRVTEVTDLVVVVQKILADRDIAFPPPEDNSSTSESSKVLFKQNKEKQRGWKCCFLVGRRL